MDRLHADQNGRARHYSTVWLDFGKNRSPLRMLQHMGNGKIGGMPAGLILIKPPKCSTFGIFWILQESTMKLSKRGEYALRGLIDLGIAHEGGREMVRVHEIVAKENISTAFLEQIFAQLRQEGIIDAKRGKNGGYFLARPADTISMGQIVRLIDGPLAPIGCVSQTRYEKCSCPDEDHCGLRMLMLDVRNAIATILDQYTLAQVVEVTIRSLRRDEVPIPFADDSTHSPASSPSQASGLFT